jgi:hypothetical protein
MKVMRLLCGVIFVLWIPINSLKKNLMPMMSDVKRKTDNLKKIDDEGLFSRSLLSNCEFIWDCENEFICCDFIFGKRCCLEPGIRVPIPIPIPIPIS